MKPTQENLTFEAIAVEFGYLESHQAREIRLLKNQAGLAAQMGTIAIQNGYLDHPQVRTIFHTQAGRLKAENRRQAASSPATMKKPTVGNVRHINKRRILVLDDSATVRYFAKMALQEEHDVVVATNGDHALDLLRRNQTDRFDLLLLDIELPEKNGFDIAQAIRQIPGYQNTPILFISMRSGIENENKAIRISGQSIIPKPDVKNIETFQALVRSNAA